MKQVRIFGHSGKAIAEATAVTVLISAFIHLTVALLSTIATRKVDYINPIDFLGFGLIAPSLLHSRMATVTAWIFLIGTGYAILHLHAHLRLTISVTKRTVPEKPDEKPNNERSFD